MKKISIGILAHVDAGKTTLSEAMLYTSGATRKLGRVDHKDAFLDTHTLERSRGITIFSKQAVMKIGDDEITLLDTPGHVDFSAEAERVLQVLDYAILLISGTDGVQSHTETLWYLLKSYHIPVFIFVNKMDISGIGKELLMAELERRLDGGCIDFSGAEGGIFTEEQAEAVSLRDEAIMSEYLENSVISAETVIKAINKRKIFPCFFGSALKMKGIDTFLNGLGFYTKEKQYGEEFAASVFKITEDEQGNRLTHLKVTGGSLKVKSLINGEKVNAVRIYSGTKFKTIDEAEAGTVCAVTGISSAYAGQGLGTAADSPLPLLEPLFSYKIILPEGLDVYTALQVLRRLEEEDPQLRIVWNEQLREIHLQLMGEIQLEVLKSVISERFGFEVGFGEGSIAYRETIAEPVEGIGHYEPLRHYAEVHLLMEPTERGSGLRFLSECREDKLDRNWQRLILTHLAEKKHIGVLTGSPITDMKITLIAGRAHLKHTEGGDFRQATYRAVRQGLMSAESVLLEPWYRFSIKVPTECIGRVMTDLQRFDAEFSHPEQNMNETTIEGSAPAAAMRGYQSEVVAFTKGKGRMSCIPDGYRPCRNTEDVIAERGYNAESDIDNPADSVFCSHGAGYAVKWYEVPNYAHINTGLSDTEEVAAEKPQKLVNEFREQKATDKELMAIFERTYGKIKRDERSAMRTERKKEAKPYKGTPLPTGPEYLLVDGYNIIFAWDKLKKLAEDNLDLARNELINILCNYQGFKRCELIVVFDAYKVKGNKGEVEQVGGISVVYTKEAETADMYIEKATRKLGGNHRVRVATSDRLEQLIILGGGAQRVSASEFRAEVDETEKAIRSYLE